ncbi:MAG: hypothetical protein IRZ10_05755 [Thermoflavifilum sp.]|nr:hypothetical protein [Thermoflavifilum sp.]MCL6513909.1 hypothetical protein [Alicyclobacillus sp.]
MTQKMHGTTASTQTYAPSDARMSQAPEHRKDVDEHGNEAWIRTCLLDYYHASRG